MQFKNLKASELDGRVELPGLNEWIESLNGTEAALRSPPPRARQDRRRRRDCPQARARRHAVRPPAGFEYPDSREAFRDLLTIIENLRSIVFQAEGIGRLGGRFQEAGDASALDLMRDWLADKKDRLRSRGVVLVATARSLNGLPEDLLAQFDKVFSAP